MSEERHFRKLSELSLIDNYLFGLFIQEATEEYFMKSDVETATDCKSEYVKNLEKKIKPIKNSRKLGDDFMSYQEAMYNERIEGKIAGAIETYFEVGKSPEEIIGKIIEKFTLSHKEAEKYVNQYRPKAN